MKLVVQQFLTLDGVSQGPGSPDEDRSDGFSRGGWFVPFVDETLMTHARKWVSHADAFLFGGNTYRNFARDWPAMNDPSDPVATALNNLPKYVVSSTLSSADWAPTTQIRGNVIAEVGRLKQASGRELQIHGSARLAGALVAAGLVDELRLAVAPVVLGQGRRLFANAGGEPVGFKLLSTIPTPGGLAIQTYERTQAPRFDVYDPSTQTRVGRT